MAKTGYYTGKKPEEKKPGKASGPENKDGEVLKGGVPFLKKLVHPEPKPEDELKTVPESADLKISKGQRELLTELLRKKFERCGFDEATLAEEELARVLECGEDLNPVAREAAVDLLEVYGELYILLVSPTRVCLDKARVRESLEELASKLLGT